MKGNNRNCTPLVPMKLLNCNTRPQKSLEFAWQLFFSIKNFDSPFFGGFTITMASMLSQSELFSYLWFCAVQVPKSTTEQYKNSF